MFIYKITNTVNDKVYIGQTIRPVEKRFERHINDALNNVIDTHFARAIRKYGKENFSVEQIDTAKSQDELTRKEHYWISFYDSVNSGYNETGAEYKCGGNTYKSKSVEELGAIAEKIRSTKVGSQNPMSRGVKCKSILSGDELHFGTVEQCKNFFGEKTHRFISNRVSYETVVPYQGEWMIAYEENDFKYERKHKTGTIVDIEILATGEVITFYSKREAAKALGVSHNSIRDDAIIKDIYKITIPDKKCIDYP